MRNRISKLCLYGLFWVIHLCSFGLKTQAQNLIYNGSFELGICPKVSGYNYNIAMPVESGWLNATTAKQFRCEDLCDINSWKYYAGGLRNNALLNYSTVLGDTWNRSNCCGRGCHSLNYAPKKFDKDFVAVGILNYDSFRMWTSGYLTQKLSVPLIEKHDYYFYMFYTYFSYYAYWLSQGRKVGHYEFNNLVPPLTKHDGYGVAFSTYFNRIDNLFIGTWVKQDLLPTVPNQRKLRFTTSYDTLWRKLEGTFNADSAYSYLTLGNFWKTEEINFNPTPDTLQYFMGPIYIDSINMWDVTHRILADSQFCRGQKATLKTENFSRGITGWFDSNGILLGNGDTLELVVTQDSLIFSKRYFSEIEYTTTDSIWLKIKGPGSDINVKRIGDSCKLPASLTALPDHLTYTWNGTNTGDNNFITSQTGMISVVATDSNNCTYNASYTVYPEVEFTVSLLSDTCREFATIRMQPTVYTFYFGEQKISNPFNTAKKGNIFIIAEQTNGCRDTQAFFIPLCVVESDLLWLPNAFTPDNNGLNDGFSPVSPYIKSYQITIYNRWGERIFESQESGIPWDGTYRGLPVSDGVYLYQVTIELINKERLNRSGTVTLLR
jgi:gliding motility-associated-like protein